MDKQGFVYESEQQMQEHADYYVNLFDLGGWNIEVNHNTRAANMRLQNVSGEISCTAEIKSAVIRILDPVDYPDDLIAPQDQEQTLVHELLHLVFSVVEVGMNETQEVLNHQIIDMLAKALVEARRCGCTAPITAPDAQTS